MSVVPSVSPCLSCFVMPFPIPRSPGRKPIAEQTHHAHSFRRRSARRLLGNSCADRLAPRGLATAGRWGQIRTHPLVKTFSKEVLPQAPSPLNAWCGCQSIDRVGMYGMPPLVASGASTHSSTSLRWTVLLPPSPQGMISERSGKRSRFRGRPRGVRGVRAGLGKVREKRLRRVCDSIVGESSERSIG